MTNNFKDVSEVITLYIPSEDPLRPFTSTIRSPFLMRCFRAVLFASDADRELARFHSSTRPPTRMRSTRSAPVTSETRGRVSRPRRESSSRLSSWTRNILARPTSVASGPRSEKFLEISPSPATSPSSSHCPGSVLLVLSPLSSNPLPLLAFFPNSFAKTWVGLEGLEREQVGTVAWATMASISHG
eukprot:CAMPEP_0206607490 /NCGR_PEP_ID=MMETSP0325_2-20121206/52215_1 /ASSEMBLY_ACC=CAM_ASM_000347 /TAXON_ID=2866 /ORGANISM="Crypthecodinium cohnii, Strain Seligo" /LENGTH=185 /DNA_ID=CAMNT_0054124581 /DNA_START=122 /DNA_END=679 /DNA_ORIENTATION=-